MKYGVGVEEGCVVVVRPDQYVGFVTGLDGEAEDIGDFFRGVFREGLLKG